MTVGRLADAATARQNVDPHRGIRCSVWRTLAALPPEDRDDLASLLARPVEVMRHQAISDALHDALGVDITAFSIGRHRAGKCRCGPAD